MKEIVLLSGFSNSLHCSLKRKNVSKPSSSFYESMRELSESFCIDRIPSVRDLVIVRDFRETKSLKDEDVTHCVVHHSSGTVSFLALSFLTVSRKIKIS